MLGIRRKEFREVKKWISSHKLVNKNFNWVIAAKLPLRTTIKASKKSERFKISSLWIMCNFSTLQESTIFWRDKKSSFWKSGK